MFQTLLESDDVPAIDLVKFVTINLFLLYHIASLDDADDYESLGKDEHHVWMFLRNLFFVFPVIQVQIATLSVVIV